MHADNVSYTSEMVLVTVFFSIFSRSSWRRLRNLCSESCCCAFNFLRSSTVPLL